MNKAERILDFAMKMELEARDFYLDSIQKVGRAETRNLLATLADWEKEHYDFLKKQRDGISDTGKWLPDAKLPEEVSGGAGIVSEKQRGTEVDDPLGEPSSDFSVLRMALAIEDDFR